MSRKLPLLLYSFGILSWGTNVYIYPCCRSSLKNDGFIKFLVIPKNIKLLLWDSSSNVLINGSYSDSLYTHSNANMISIFLSTEVFGWNQSNAQAVVTFLSSLFNKILYLICSIWLSKSVIIISLVLYTLSNNIPVIPVPEPKSSTVLWSNILVNLGIHWFDVIRWQNKY